MKSDGRLARYALRAPSAMPSTPCSTGCGHNIRKILAHLRAFLLAFLAISKPSKVPPDSHYRRIPSTGAGHSCSFRGT